MPPYIQMCVSVCVCGGKDNGRILMNIFEKVLMFAFFPLRFPPAPRPDGWLMVAVLSALLLHS